MGTGHSDPFISIIIPTHNRSGSLARSLESLAALEYPPDRWEVIVVDDGSSQDYSAAVDPFRERLPLTFTTIARSGPASARNRGAELARGEYLLFTDDDCTVEPDLLRQYADGFAFSGRDALGGQSLNGAPQDLGARAWTYLIDFLYRLWVDREGNALILITNNTACRREVFESLGGFDVDFPLAASEDRDFSMRLLAAGYTQSYLPQAKVWHHQKKLSAWRYIRLQYRYGHGAYAFHRKSGPAKKKVLPRFGRYPRLQYVTALLRYIATKPVPLNVGLVLLCGNVAHFLGSQTQRLRALATGDTRRRRRAGEKGKI